MTGRKRTIVGIDPGSTSAIAVLDTKGGLRELESKKHMGDEEIIRKVSEAGKPVLVATDKGKVPSTVEEVATNFGAKVFTPDDDLSVHGKKELTRNMDYENLHERDALAAALNAYNSFKDKFKNIEARMDELNIQDLAPEVKEAVVTGEARNVAEAVEMVLGDDEEETEEEEEITNHAEQDLEDKIDNYRQMLMQERKNRKKLEEYNKKLEERIEQLEEEVEELEDEKEGLENGVKEGVMEKRTVKKLRRNLRSKEKRAKNLEREKKELERKLERVKAFESLRKEGKIPVRELDVLSPENLRKENRFLKLKDGILFAREVRGDVEEILEVLKEFDVLAVIGKFSEEIGDEFVSQGVYTSSPDKLEISESEGTKYLEYESLDSITKEEREGFLKWLKKYRKRGL